MFYNIPMSEKKKYKPNTAISVYELFHMFPDAESARLYIERKRWADGVVCPHCGSMSISAIPSKPGRYHCSDCRKQFSVRTGTIFENSKIPLHQWMFALYYIVTDRKGLSSMQLSKELGVTQKTAWFMEHRIRNAMSSHKFDGLLDGIIECDETYVGGKEGNKHSKKKLRAGRGAVGKAAVFGMVQRGGEVKSVVVPDTTRDTLLGIIGRQVEETATVNTDESRSYIGLAELGYDHKSVNHSAKQFVDRMATTNSIESVWALLKRGFYGTFHKFSTKHLQRYVDEFDFRWNAGNCKYPTMERVDSILGGCWGSYLPYKRLIGCNCSIIS
jgi:transposase-like protein